MKRLTILAALATMIFAGCNNVREKVLPQISGKAGEVVIVIEDQVWKSTTDTIINILKADVPGLPQSEPMFDVVRIPNSAFTEIFQRHRNIISCRIAADSAASIKVASDIWATPQTVIQIVAPSAQAFEQLFSDNREKIVGLLLKAEQDRIIKNYSTFPERQVMDKLAKATGVTMTIPKGYTFDMDTTCILNGDTCHFVWISHETPEISQGLFVYYYDYTDSLMLTRDRLMAMRDLMCKRFVGGPSDGSYMTTVAFEDVTTFRSFNRRGQYTAELRGLWETHGDFMGGPFVSLTQYDAKCGRIVTVDGYVYAGKKDKRNYMRQVEAIMSTMQFVNE
ncbi:MAG: DUF4837 family protein [Salinivirgaceae bacterium]|nr:DUF4837 family protein [Salinivirgaceae bacterium]